jgi:predicted metal-dependent hydrolase
MADARDIPDPRFLAGIELFNRGAFFDAHEVWEELWRDCPSAERRFYRALIQAAVSAYHWGRGNAAGARRLYQSGRRYMDPFRPAHRGLAVDAFWDALAAHLAGGPMPTITLR